MKIFFIIIVQSFKHLSVLKPNFLFFFPLGQKKP